MKIKWNQVADIIGILLIFGGLAYYESKLGQKAGEYIGYKKGYNDGYDDGYETRMDQIRNRLFTREEES